MTTIIYVDNLHDEGSRVPRDQVIQQLSQSEFTSEMAAQMAAGQLVTVPGPTNNIVVVDFMQIRDVLPISQAPCVLILFDQLSGPANAQASRIQTMVNAAIKAIDPPPAP